VLLTEVFANGGIQRFNRTLLTAIEKIGCECDVLSLADTEEARARWLPASSPLRVRVFARQKVAFAAAVTRAIASGKYDDVLIGHVHFLEFAVGARVFRRRPRLLVVAHGVEVWDRVTSGWRRALKAIDRILCVSEYTAQSIRNQAPGIPADRYLIFPNALADSWVETMGALAAATEAGSARRAPYLLAVARLSHFDRTKGIITAFEAFAQLDRPDLEFVVAGDGDDLPFLRQVVARLGIVARVRFAGAVSDAELVALYRDCAAFVLPSGQEGFGIVFIEAMFFGAPVIAAAEKGAIDVMRDGESGLMVPYGDVVSLTHAIERVLSDDGLRARLCAAARANVTGDGRFTAGAFQRRLAALLEDDSPRVVFVNRYFHPDESATSRIVSDLARRLSRAGENVSVVTSRQLYHDSGANLAAEDVIDGVAIHRVSGANRGRGTLSGRAFDYLSFHLAAGWRLFRLLRRGDVVVAKTDPPLLSVTVAIAARLRGARLVNWLQDLFPEVAHELGIAIRPRWVARFLRWWRDVSLRQAACNVAIGARMAERIERAGVGRAAIRVIPNWANVADIVPHPRAANSVRAELGLTPAHFVVGYSGNLGRAHEYGTLLDAARRLTDLPEIVFVMTGAGAKFDDMRSEVEALALVNVLFQPFQAPARLAESMAAADVHVVSLLPQLEGLIVPSKFYGILAAARPAVFIGDTDGELAREIRNLDCGVSVAVGDGAALAEQIAALRAQPERVAQLGANARRAAEERFSSEHALSAWQALLAAVRVEAMPALDRTPVALGTRPRSEV
jgi:glycosyltransferase involved in cell wall biosynthesis